MARFLLRRVVSAILALLIIITITFFLMHLVPGGPFNSERMDPLTQANMREKYALDEPLLEQFGLYLQRLTKFDLGPSLILRGRSVNSIIMEKFPISAKLGGLTLIFTISVGLFFGVIATLFPNTWIDRIIMLITTLGLSVPAFVVGTLFLVIFGAVWQIAPVTWTDQPSNYILPILTYSFYPICFITKLTRSSMIETLKQDYIKTAYAKGMSVVRVYIKHALRNSIIPIITYLGPLTAYLITGGFAVEKIFSIPGLGRFFIDSIGNRDYPLIMGTTIFLAMLVITINTIVDILYSIIDPRIQLE